MKKKTNRRASRARPASRRQSVWMDASATQLVELPDKTRVVIVLSERESEVVTDPRESAAYPASSVLAVAGEHRYEILRVVAKGGMAVICEAREPKGDRTVAMKFLRCGGEHYEEDHVRFMREAKITSQLEHPNIIPVHEVGQDTDGNDFYTMKFVRGVTLTEVLSDIRKGRREAVEKYQLRDLLTVFQKTCDAVAFAHSRGVVHRDLKPGNVMIGDFGEVLVLDWGLAKRIHPGAGEGPEADEAGGPPLAGEKLPVDEDTGEVATISIQTDKLGAGIRSETGRIIGTPSFMSPEHARAGGASVDERSDVYALGAILYSILTLQVPVRGTTLREVLRKIITGDIVPPAEAERLGRLPHCPDGEIPAVLSDIAMRALATDPAARYPSVREMQEDIEAYQNGLIWHVVIDEDFSNPERTLSRWEPIGGQCDVSKGELRLRGGEPQMLLLKRDLPGDVRIDFECREEGLYLNDVGCILGAVRQENSWDTSISGYAFKYGAYTNSFNVLTRLDRKIWSEQASPLSPGRTFSVRVERVGARLRMSVNNRKACSVVDPDPLSGSHRTLVGLLGWIADTRYTRIRVYSLGTPWLSDILDIAERHLQKGHCNTAMDLFSEVLGSFPEADRMERARRGFEAAQARHAILSSLPAWREKLAGAWPGVAVQLGLEKDGLTVDIPRNSGVGDLRPLEGMPISVLRCPLNEIASLEPLRGMPLVTLDCPANQITSLEPLRGMRLTGFNCGINRVRSLEPLRGMPIVSLSCEENDLEGGLEALRGMPLTWLHCGRCDVVSLEPLRGAPLVMLFCDANRIHDLEPLCGMRLTELSCSYNRIATLEPLRGMLLNDLNCAGNEIESLDPLQGMPLSTFKGQCNRLTSLESLKEMPLTTLMCGGNRLRGIGPFVKDPPKNFLFDCDTIPSEELEWILKKWKRDFRLERYARDVEVLLALRRGDTQGLRALAREFRGRKYLFVPRFLGWDEARRLCGRFGGHLVAITSREENDFLASFFPFGGSWFWIGLSTSEGVPQWATGEPFTFSAFIDALHGKRSGPKICRGTNWFYDIAPDARNCFVIEWTDSV